MGILEIQSSSLIDVDNPKYKANSSKSVASEYSKILAAKISNVKADVQAMEAIQEQLNEIRDLQEELTGEVKLDEDSGNANRTDNAVTEAVEIETVKLTKPEKSRSKFATSRT